MNRSIYSKVGVSTKNGVIFRQLPEVSEVVEGVGVDGVDLVPGQQDLLQAAQERARTNLPEIKH